MLAIIGAESFVFHFVTQKYKDLYSENHNFALFLYGCKTWPLTLREERRLRVFENRVQRRIFGSKRDEVTGEWRNLHYDVVKDLYSSPCIIWLIKSRRMRWAGHVARMGDRTGVYRVLVGKRERMSLLGSGRPECGDNIKVDTQEVEFGGWTGSSLLRIRTGSGDM